ncbi:MAG: HPr family phosphocarrier protein [Gammaproteobacteria bacterium]|nr:HPr family phosphocarrier protein [Gammaproteobacteria bacterium]
MQNREVLVINKLGLHARAAVKLVKLASSFQSSIQLVRDTHCVNGKSIMGVMMLAASKGTTLDLVADGEDENQALDSLVDLFHSGFEENIE